MEQATLAYYNSPVGWLELKTTEKGLSKLSFMNNPPIAVPDEPFHPILEMTISQLDGYFFHKLHQFDLPLDLKGSDFELQVWNHLLPISYGQTTSYGNISSIMKNPGAIRAIGSAIGKNPVAIIVPCHRVIGSDNKLTGFGGGIWRKEWLLKHEGILLI